MGVPGGGLPRAWAAALCLSLAAGDLPTLATTPELPFQKFPVLPPQCRNNIYAEPVDPADVAPGGHRRLCGPARGTSWNGKVDLTVLGGAFVGPGARTLQLVTAQLERGAPPRFFNYARAVGAAKSLKCAWPDGTTTPASVFMQAQDMVAVHQCAAPPAARTARTVRLWGRGQDLTLDLCDHDEEYPRVYDVTFCAGPVFGDPNAAHVVEWFELNRRHWASARAALYLRLEPGPRERLARALAWYVAHGLVELVDWAPVAPVARGDVDDDQWDHRAYHDQVLMYNHCLNRYRSTSHWIFNLDTDEVVDGVPGARLGRAAQREHLANETAVELQTIAHTGPSVGTWVADAHLLRQAGPITTDWHRPKALYRANLVSFAWIHGISWPKRDACAPTRRLNHARFWIRHYVDRVERGRCDALEPGNPCNATAAAPPSRSLGRKRGVDVFARRPYGHEARFLGYVETEGLNNQRIALENARSMARLLGRTLVVPDALAPHDAEDTAPTYTCHVFDCDHLGVPWVGRAQFAVEIGAGRG